MVWLSGLYTIMCIHDNVPIWLTKAKLSMVGVELYIMVCGFIVHLKIFMYQFETGSLLS